MSQRCTALKRDGEKCRCWAMAGTEPPCCLYHADNIPEASAGRRYEPKPIGKERQIAIIEQAIREVRRSKIPVLEKSRELRALIAQLSELKAPENAKDQEPDWRRKVDTWKKQASSKQ